MGAKGSIGRGKDGQKRAARLTIRARLPARGTRGTNSPSGELPILDSAATGRTSCACGDRCWFPFAGGPHVRRPAGPLPLPPCPPCPPRPPLA
ncbi:hypothetical protein KM043_012360 [Ampulex compressa]|nr:hypothetical protein KM043_012360 [Ampulex compressa]